MTTLASLIVMVCVFDLQVATSIHLRGPQGTEIEDWWNTVAQGYPNLTRYHRPAFADESKEVLERAQLAAPGGNNYRREFVGSPSIYGDMSGNEFSLLYLSGLKETDALLDIGCGSLGLGRVAIPYLQPGNYHCIEANDWLVQDALHYEIGEGILSVKAPKFAFNKDFEAPSQQVYPFLIAYKMFGHTGIDMLKSALAKLKANMNGTSVFFNTFVEEPIALSCANTSGWIYPGSCQMTAPEIREVANQSGFEAVQLKWADDKEVWWAWCLAGESSRCSKLADYIPGDLNPRSLERM